MSVEDVKSQLAQVSRAMESAGKTLDEATTEIRAAFEMAAAVTYDSQHASVQGGLAKIKVAVAEVDQIRHRLKGAIDRTDRYRAGL